MTDPCADCPFVQIRDAMRTLGWTADELYRRITNRNEEGNTREARMQLDCVDKLLAAKGAMEADDDKQRRRAGESNPHSRSYARCSAAVKDWCAAQGWEYIVHEVLGKRRVLRVEVRAFGVHEDPTVAEWVTVPREIWESKP